MRTLGALAFAVLLLAALFLFWSERRPDGGALVGHPAARQTPEGPARLEEPSTPGLSDVSAPAAPAERSPAPDAPRADPGSGQARITGRLLEPDRSPHADAWFHARLQLGPQTLWGTMVRTDADGRFVHELEGRLTPPAGCTFLASARREGLIDRRAAVPLPRLRPGEQRDLGELVLVPWTGWIRGTVTDRSGQPLSYFDGRIEVLTSDGLELDRARIDQEGHFVVDLHDGAVLRDGLSLLARADGWFQAEAVVAREPGEEVRITLERGGRIEGSLSRSSGLDLVLLSVGARLQLEPERLRHGMIEADGRFAIEGLDRGEYAFALLASSMGGAESALLEIPGIPVRREETTRDPRLENLNLAAYLHTASLGVFDRDGDTVSDATVYVLEQDGRVLSRAGTKRQPLVLVLPADRSVDALVVHETSRPVAIPAVAGEQLVTLEPGIRLFLRSARLIALEEPSRGTLLRLSPEDGGPGPAGVFDVELPTYFGNGEVLEVVFPFPGLYRLQVMTLQRVGTFLGQGTDDRYLPTGVVLDVLERDAGSQRELELPPDLLDLADPRLTPR